jgi:hypothetical protein
VLIPAQIAITVASTVPSTDVAPLMPQPHEISSPCASASLLDDLHVSRDVAVNHAGYFGSTSLGNVFGISGIFCS